MGSVLQDKGKHCQNSNSAIILVEHLRQRATKIDESGGSQLSSRSTNRHASGIQTTKPEERLDYYRVFSRR
jgi:hypothetical protein